jgi:ABC-type sugar transport system substrate-binding protein
MAVVAGLALAGLPFIATAQEGTKTARELRADYDKALQGKTIAYLPIALGVPLSDEWGRVVKEEAEWRGMKYVVRDPNNNPSAMQQALTALVDQKPDVLIVQNPSVTLLMKDLKRAESQGTHVIQINMSSNYKSDAFVGADWHEIGRLLAQDVVKQCGTGSGKSGEVQIVQGELTAAASVDQVGGLMEVFNKDPAIKVVSNQAANWDANTALNITATVIQQHPNLCASVGFWGIMESGAAQAIRNAGKIGQVKVYASGEGSQLDCDQINQGNFYKFLSYKATEQGHDLMFAAETLLESGEKPGTRHLEYFTRPIWLDKTNANGANCFALPKKS